jgi:SAM-dependent methyltransferase
MNNYINKSDSVIELGAGHGLSKHFIKSDNYVLSDVDMNPWIDIKLDVLSLNSANMTFDVIICSHMIHHLANPSRFFQDIQHILRPGGLILIQDINTSFIMRLLLYITCHEGWSYNVDVFDESVIANDPNDSWSANCAIPEQLFKNSKRFEKAFPWFRVEKSTLNECILFPLSGGIAATVSMPNLPIFMLKFLRLIDRCLVGIAPNIFAFGRSVVLRKIL